MSEIKVGDLVTWTSRAKQYCGHIVTWHERLWRAHVEADNGKLYFVLKKKIARVDVTPSMLAHDAAAAARSDTQAIASLGVICTDYEAQREALGHE